MTGYSFSDFILFSHAVLLATIEDYNKSIWPLQLFWLIAIVVVFRCLLSTNYRPRIIIGIVAEDWCWCGLVFHAQYFSSINWAANYLAGLFVFQAILLLVCQIKLHLADDKSFTKLAVKIYSSLFLLLGVIPIELIWHSKITQIMLFGWGPERTALGSLVIICCIYRGWRRIILSIIPLLWCLLAALTQLSFYDRLT